MSAIVTCGSVTGRRLRLAAAAVTAAVSLAFAQDPKPAAAGELWFDRVTAPADMPLSVWEKAVLEIHTTLNRGALAANFLDFVPPTPAPRVVFVTGAAADGKARTRFAAGASFREAASAAVTAALAEGEPFRNHAWLKVDVVQHALMTADYQVRNTLLVQPTLVGLAFSKGSGFAFLPDLLTQGGLVTGLRLLDTDRAAEPILGGKGSPKRLGDWNLVASYTGPQVVTFFECLSFFTAGDGVQLLFRGHPVASPVTVDRLKDTAARAAEFLLQTQNARGEFTQAPGRWLVGGPVAHERLADQAGAVLALLEAQELLPADKRLAAAAAKGIDCLLKNVQPFTFNPKAAYLTDGARVNLDDNAMAAIALARYEKTTRQNTYRASLQKLGLYLLAQLQPDRSLVGERLHPSGNLKAPAEITASAQTVLAFLRLYEITRESVYLDAAQQCLASAVNRWCVSREMDKLPLDAWLLLAVNEVFTYTHDKYLGREVERLVLASETAQPLDVPFPDYLGGFDKSSAVTPVALRAAGLVAAADFLRDSRRPTAADKAAARAHLALMFQLQAQADTASMAHLPDAARWLGAFREDLLDYRFSLAGQYQNLLAVAVAANSMSRQQLTVLPLGKPQETALATARTQILTFPRCLPTQLPPLPVLKDNPGTITPVDTSGQNVRRKPVEVKIATPEGMYPQPTIIKSKPAKK